MIQTSSLAFDPLLPPLPLTIAIGIPLALCLYSMTRRAPGSVLRLATVAAISAVLLNPALVVEQRQPIRDVAVVVVDQSPSMALGTRAAQRNQALESLQEKLSSFADLDVRTVSSPAGGDETKLFALADRAFADVPSARRAGLILLTDGQIHDVPAADAAPRYGPVHALLAGSPQESDRRIRLITAPAFGLVGQTVEATLRVEDLPESAGTATLLLHDESGVTRRLTVQLGEDVKIQIPVTHAGMNMLALEAEPKDGELTAANNRAAIIVNGVRDRLRVLLISGFPHNGERVWRNLLKSDPAVDLVHFTILRSAAKDDAVPQNEMSLIPFPVHELFAVKLRQFDLVIFDRYRDRDLLAPNYLLNIADYVRGGGALLDASGPDLSTPGGLSHTPLATVLPSRPTGELVEDSFVPRLTPTGKRHPVTAALPRTGDWAPWFRMSAVDPGAAPVLMEGAGEQPLLILNRIGQGRVAQLTSDQIWLWARGYEKGGPHAELLRPLLHWLMSEPELEENRLLASVDGNRLSITRRSLTASTTPVKLTAPDGSTREVAMQDDGSQASGQADVTAPGIYRLTDGTLNTLAIVGRPNAPELADQRATTEALTSLQDKAGGGNFWLAEKADGPTLQRISPNSRDHGANWLGLFRNGDYTVSGFTSTSLLPGTLAAALFLLAALWGWRREGR